MYFFHQAKDKKTLFLKPGLINETANPQRAKHSNYRQENVGRELSFCQNSKKMNDLVNGRNANTHVSEKIKSHRKEIGNSFGITGKAGHNCPKSKVTSKLCSKQPLKDGRKRRRLPNRRIALIREHLERINENIDHANAQRNRAHGENAFRMVENTVRVGRPKTRVVENAVRVDRPKTRVVEKVVRVRDDVFRGDNNIYFPEEHLLINDEHGLGDEESDTQSKNKQPFLHSLHGDMNNPNLSRESKGISRGIDTINNEKIDDQKPSQKQQPMRRIRKMWTKDVLVNFPITQRQVDKGGAHNIIRADQRPQSTGKTPDKTSEIPQLKSVKIVRERIYISGGVQKNDYFAHKAIMEHDPEMGIFVTRAAMCTGRYNHGIAQLGDEIYQVGGNSGFFEQLRSVESYSPKHGQWTARPSMGEARDEFSLAVCDGCLYAIGGHNGIQDLRSVEKFDARENSWSFVSPMRNYRAGACAVAVDDRYAGNWLE